MTPETPTLAAQIEALAAKVDHDHFATRQDARVSLRHLLSDNLPAIVTALRQAEITFNERVEYEDRILAAEMELVAARRVLLPFATRACGWEQNHKYAGSDSTQISHRLGDFRAARSTLGKIDDFLKKDEDHAD